MEFRARNKGEDIQEYNNKKWEAAGVLAKKVAQAEAAKIYLVPTAVYALIMYITGFILIFILRRSN